MKMVGISEHTKKTVSSEKNRESGYLRLHRHQMFLRKFNELEPLSRHVRST